jgi:hypothetical protein
MATFVDLLRQHVERVRRQAWGPGTYLRVYPWQSACGPVAYKFDPEVRKVEEVFLPSDPDGETDWEPFAGELDPRESTIPKTTKDSLMAFMRSSS